MDEQATDAQRKLLQKLGIECPVELSKKAASSLIETGLMMKESKGGSKPSFPQKNATASFSGPKNTTMYVSYAKDIFIALYEKNSTNIDEQILMDRAIALVKSAQEEFL